MRLRIWMLALLGTPLSAQVTPGPAWAVSSSPTLLIGNDANPREQFQRIRSVARFPDGAIVVANGASQELRVFSESGEYVRSLSRAGSGPGEMRALGAFFRAGDTLVASEAQPGEGSVHYFTTTKSSRRLY